MIKNGILTAGVALAALGLTGCNPPHPHRDAPLKAISTLDCPDEQGDLTRKSVAADGKSCLYASDQGAQVTLQLVGLDGQDAKTALAPLEAKLQAELPATTTIGTGSASAAVAGATAKDDHVDINLPGLHVHANGHGETDRGDATIDVGGAPGHDGVTVNAADNGAVIRMNERGSGIRLSVIYASDKPGPNGWKTAGYEARGPASGPLAVVSVLAKTDDRDDLRHDMRALLKRNVGG